MSPSWSPDARRLAYVSFEGDASQVYVQTLAHRHARARLGARGREQLAGVLAGRAAARAHAVARSRQPRHLHARPRDAGAAPAHDRRRDRHRGHVVAGRPADLLHVGPRGRPADLPRRRGARRPRGARDLRGRLQRAPAHLAGRQADRRGVRAEQHLSDRRRSTRRAACSQVLTNGRLDEIAELTHRTARRSSTRRATADAACSRPSPPTAADSAGDRIGRAATCASLCGDRIRGPDPSDCLEVS